MSIEALVRADVLRQLAEVVGRNGGRFAIHAIRIEPGYMVATDANGLVTVEAVTMGDGTAMFDASDADLLASVQQSPNVVNLVAVTDGVSSVGVGRSIRVTQIQGVYPDWRAIVPSIEGRRTVTLDAALLKRMADVISDDNGVTLFIDDNGGPIAVAGNRGAGVMMPCEDNDFRPFKLAPKPTE